MAFENVRVRLPDGQEFGPVAWSAMLQWHQEGRVPADAHLVDHATGEARPASMFPALQRIAVTPVDTFVPPTPVPGSYQGVPRRYQEVEVLEPAGFWLRVVAVLIDGILLAVVGGITGAIVGGILGASNADEDTIEAFSGLIGLAIGWLYFAMMESSGTQATLGKMALGLKVTDVNGDQIGFGRATGRHFAKFLSMIILYIGFIMAGFTEQKQGLHDIIAGTLVVRK
jgi:uncharacterized RDD family membrane protein YckC